MHSKKALLLDIGSTYRDKRGVEWRVRAFLHDEGRWFIEDPGGAYVDVQRADGKRGGKFVKKTTFIKSLECVAV